MFDFTLDDLRSNNEGRISIRQNERLEKLGGTTKKNGEEALSGSLFFFAHSRNFYSRPIPYE